LALLHTLTTELLKHGKITTTEPKAREVRRMAEKLITVGKQGRAAALAADGGGEGAQEKRAASVHARRLALRVVRDKDVLDKTFGEIAEKYAERPGGYTRVVKLGNRPGDAAPMALIELV
jgi:large subunit ribosomal protein L17